MTSQSEWLASRLAKASDAFIVLIDDCDDECWQAVVADEGWPVGFVARHVAWGMLAESRLIELAARGEPMPVFSIADIDESNRRNLAKHANPPRDETLALLRRESERAAAIVRGLDDTALDRTADLPAFSSEPITVENLVNDLLIWHVESHTAGVRAIVEG